MELYVRLLWKLEKETRLAMSMRGQTVAPCKGKKRLRTDILEPLVMNCLMARDELFPDRDCTLGHCRGV